MNTNKIKQNKTTFANFGKILLLWIKRNWMDSSNPVPLHRKAAVKDNHSLKPTHPVSQRGYNLHQRL